MDMRGLSNFISEIRDVAHNRAEEVARVEQELGKIRAKFKNSTSLSSYDRKKYTCKLIFIFMLGYDVDFGHMEAVQLLSGQSASEKLIGYLGITVLLHENHEIMPLTVHTISKDLTQGDELAKALALTAVANVGTADHAHQTADAISELCKEEVSRPVVRKKALLTALRYFRKYPGVIKVANVAPQAVQAIMSPDFSVSMAAAALTLGFLGDPEAAPYVGGAQLAAIKKLEGIINRHEAADEWLYYGVPVPWLQVKLLRILQYFPPPEKGSGFGNVLGKVCRAAQKIIIETQQMQSNKRSMAVNRMNSMVSTLVEVVSIAIHWDNDAQLLQQCRDALGHLITDKRDANCRYIGLTLLTRLSFCSLLDFKEQIVNFQNHIVHSLHDPDNSIRLRALDLLYAMCGKHNAAHIVQELLDYLPVANPMIRQDLVLMIAILAEKFCGEISWYVEVILNIIEQAGDHVTEDIWQRVVQIIVNTPSVQKHAVGLIFRSLTNKTQACHETTVKVGALLLGEFGYQIALIQGSTPHDQLNALHGKFALLTDATKAMLLTTYVKFYNLYDDPSVRERVKKILFSCRSNFDVDVQQRAAEYFALVSSGVKDEILQAALEPLPAFELQAGSIVAKLRQRHKGEERNLWSEKVEARDTQQLQESKILKAASGSEVAQAAAQQQQQQNSSSSSSQHVDPTDSSRQQQQSSASGGSASAAPDVELVQRAVTEDDTGSANAAAPPVSGSRQLSDLLGGGTPTKAPPPPAQPRVVPTQQPPPKSSANDLDALFGNVAPPPASASGGPSAQASERQAMERFLDDLQLTSGGPLFENDKLRITVAMEVRVADARLKLTVQNRSDKQFNHFAVKIVFTPSACMLQMQPPPKESIDANGGACDVMFAARSLFGFSERPQILVSGRFGGDQQLSLTLPLPILPPKFVDPYKLDDAKKFTALWDNTPSGNASTPGFVAVADNLRFGEAALASGRGDAILAVECCLFQKLRLHTLRASTTCILGIGAYATHPKDTPQFVPVMVQVEVENDDPLADAKQSVLRLAVRSSEGLMEKQVMDLAMFALTGKHHHQQQQRPSSGSVTSGGGGGIFD